MCSAVHRANVAVVFAEAFDEKSVGRLRLHGRESVQWEYDLMQSTTGRRRNGVTIAAKPAR